METKTCLNCGDVLKGRIDKKFCDDQCRTQHNNRINVDSSTVKNITSILKKNRKILEETLSSSTEGKVKVSSKKIQDKGYNFTYHTHQYKTKTGSVYYFCFEYGFLPLEHDLYMVVKRQDY